MKRESETEDEGIREDEKVLERVGYECGQPVRERGKIVCDKNAIVMERKKNAEEKTREETVKLLRIARNDNMSSSMKLKGFL